MIRAMQWVIETVRQNLNHEEAPQSKLDVSTPIFDDVEAWLKETEELGQMINDAVRKEQR